MELAHGRGYAGPAVTNILRHPHLGSRPAAPTADPNDRALVAYRLACVLKSVRP
jgi:hypothetical protein